MISSEEAVEIFDIALTEAMERCDAIPRAVAMIQAGGWVIDDIETIIHLRAPEQEKSVATASPLTDADFLRELHIFPDVMPQRAKRRLDRWPTKRRTLVLFVAFLFISTFAGCANTRVDLGCQASTLNVANAPMQKHPAFGLRK